MKGHYNMVFSGGDTYDILYIKEWQRIMCPSLEQVQRSRLVSLTEWVVTVPSLSPVLCTAGLLLQVGAGFARVERLLQDGPAAPANRGPAGLGTARPPGPLAHHTGHRWGKKGKKTKRASESVSADQLTSRDQNIAVGTGKWMFGTRAASCIVFHESLLVEAETIQMCINGNQTTDRLS